MQTVGKRYACHNCTPRHMKNIECMISSTLWAADSSLVLVLSKLNLAINPCYEEDQRK